ncbi:MAG: DotH/IcmK family type IV secretion protein [Deltaproteobacteria bacterium]|nr:DotH/IcmK family type IV secretion protein [Deltaproteobacteria bacterium]
METASSSSPDSAPDSNFADFASNEMLASLEAIIDAAEAAESAQPAEPAQPDPSAQGVAEEPSPESGVTADNLKVSQAHQLAYEKSLEILLPASPDEVRTYRQSLDAREEALSDSSPGTMRSRTERVRLEPGFKPPVVELTPNLVTALVFTDSTGRPWPVAASVLGSGALFTAQALEGADNQIIVSALSNHAHSNLVVSLEGKDIPLMAHLTTTSAVKPRRELDGLIIFQIQEPGPKASLSGQAEPLPASVVDDLLYAFLDGLEPQGSRPVEARPSLDGERFSQVGERLYLRTRRGLLWPAPQARVSGPGGVTVYEIQAVPSILLSDGEEVMTVDLHGVTAGETFYEATR